jgi:hypothetical protein
MGNVPMTRMMSGPRRIWRRQRGCAANHPGADAVAGNAGHAVVADTSPQLGEIRAAIGQFLNKAAA